MERDWEAWLRNAATGPSDAEKERRDRTETRIRDAIGASPEIPAKDVRIFAKGSYANNTNVRLDADVDVAVEWIGSFATMKVFDAKDLQDADLDLVDVPPGSPPQTPADWRAQVERALLAAFGSAVDTSGDKAITVGASSSTLDADVVPCYRRAPSSMKGSACSLEAVATSTTGRSRTWRTVVPRTQRQAVATRRPSGVSSD